MTFKEAVESAYSNYFTLQGRARPAEYWWFVLFVLGTSFVITAFASSLYAFAGASGDVIAMFGLARRFFLYGSTIPFLAVTIRRLHDINLTGWYVLVGAVPIIGLLALLVMHCREGTLGENRFGPNPAAATNTF